MYPLIPFRIFEDHVKILSLSPIQQLRCSSLWQEIGNGWKLLLTVVTESFVLNVTCLLDPTLKCINKFRLRQKSIPSDIYMFKISKKHTKTTYQVYSKLRITTPDWHLVFLLLTLNILLTLFYYYGPECHWGWETIVSDNKFVSTDCGKYIVLYFTLLSSFWAWKIFWATCFHLYSPIKWWLLTQRSSDQ